MDVCIHAFQCDTLWAVWLCACACMCVDIHYVLAYAQVLCALSAMLMWTMYFICRSWGSALSQLSIGIWRPHLGANTVPAPVLKI